MKQILTLKIKWNRQRLIIKWLFHRRSVKKFKQIRDDKIWNKYVWINEL
jgi:hypothetical protein